MGIRNDLDPRRDGRARGVSIALIALLVGALIGPGVAAAASIAWVRVKNWPVLQKVLVTNSASAPVYTQPPAHQIVNLRGGAQILNAGSSAWQPFYTVPADKWLVITSMRAEGSGKSQMSFVALVSNDAMIHETFPITTYVDNGDYNISSVVSGVSYVPPGTPLNLSMVRNTSGTGLWSVGVWVDGYLTDRP